LTEINLSMPYSGKTLRPAIFLDRDGTIIKEISSAVRSPRQVKFLAGVAQALKQLGRAGYKLIVVTNQSYIARGLCRVKELEAVHRYIRQWFKRRGVVIDRIYYCPHHVEGKITRYRRRCQCRKPEPGMLKQAAREYKIKLEQSFMIGDSEKDLEAGKRVKCRTILVLTGKGKTTLKEIRKKKRLADYVVPDLARAVPLILREQKALLKI